MMLYLKLLILTCFRLIDEDGAMTICPALWSDTSQVELKPHRGLSWLVMARNRLLAGVYEAV